MNAHTGELPEALILENEPYSSEQDNPNLDFISYYQYFNCYNREELEYLNMSSNRKNEDKSINT